jgi:hypothetical protein
VWMIGLGENLFEVMILILNKEKYIEKSTIGWTLYREFVEA